MTQDKIDAIRKISGYSMKRMKREGLYKVVRCSTGKFSPAEVRESISTLGDDFDRGKAIEVPNRGRNPILDIINGLSADAISSIYFDRTISASAHGARYGIEKKVVYVIQRRECNQTRYFRDVKSFSAWRSA